MAKPALIPASPKAVIYARVSSKEQEREGFSIPAQLKLLREYAERKGLPILQEYTDVETAKKSGRTQFSDMVKFFKAEGRKKKDPGCRILLVEKTDRLYRNFKDYVTLDELALDIHLVKENDILSPNSRSHQKLLHGIKVVMAKNYIDNLSEEIKKGMQEKAEQGFYPSFAPLGYVNVICNGKKFIQPDPDMAPLVQKLFQWYATGRFSLLELTKKIHEEGLISRRNGLVISRGTIAKVLNNTVYYGEFQWNGKSYRGTYEPLISRELFTKVQEVLDFKGKTRTGVRKHQWAFQGLVFCGNCGCAMSGDMKKGKYVYYRCTGYKGNCPKRYVKEEELTRQFGQALEAVQLDPEIHSLLIRALRESHADETRFNQEEISKLEKERQTLETRLESIYLDKLDRIITTDFFQEKSREWKNTLEGIKAKLEKHRHVHGNYMEEGARLLDLSQQAAEIYRKLEMAEKKRILNLVLANSIWLNAQLIPKYRQPFELLAVMKAQSPEKSALRDGKAGDCEKWYTRQESNLRPLPSEGSALSS
jgi:site-specific DNA recombinase